MFLLDYLWFKGVRAGAKKIGVNNAPGSDDTPVWDNNGVKKNGEMRYPTTIAYQLDEVIGDLLSYAADFLVIGGRLVYWLPLTESNCDQPLPTHPALQVVACSRQDFGKWCRKLITMEKIREPKPDDVAVCDARLADLDLSDRISSFRDAYFSKTKSTEE